MAAKWIKTSFPGVRYREHEKRKSGVRRDQYFTIRYKLAGKDREEGLGWASEGWSAKKAYARLSELKENLKVGEGPRTLAEKREIEDARRAAKKAEAERQEKEAVTFGAFFADSYLPQAKADKKEKSVTREEGLYSVWISPVLENLSMKDVTPFHLEKLKKSMADNEQSPRSIEYALSVVRQIFNTAKRLGVYTGENPTARVKFPKPDNGRMRFLTHEEADTLLEALQAKSADVHDMALLSLYGGLRFGEVAALTWQDVDFERGTLTIRDAKAGSRYAFLTEQSAAMLKRRAEAQDMTAEKNLTKRKPSDRVFSGRKGVLDRISITFKRTVDELKLNDGIDDPRLKICFHSCRHSYASWLIEEGADLYTVQKLLGHKTNVMTQRYAHLSENRLREATQALSRAARERKAEAGQIVNLQK
ncbi:MAG TPA: tyrosine-type recombinase/integrase [Syntrophales bacterium]|jgi:integrase|nr:tyrosine-type recombinase/integrase [Syntrophales bacterium]